MLNNLFSKLSRYMPWIIYALLFLIFLIPVLNLRLFLDDHVLVFPALTHTYVQDFLNYTYGFGLYRPLRLVFLYYPLYTLYSVLPWAPYLILFAVHFVTGILVYLISKKYLDEKFSFLLSLSYIVFPFFTEQYAWIATGTTVVNFIIFLQVYIALVSKLPVQAKLTWLFILQFVGAFIYDTIFFNFILLGVLMYIKREEWQLTIKKILLYTGLFAVPSVLYVFLRGFVFYAHNEATVRELQLKDLPNILSIQWHNLSVFLSAQNFLFFGAGSWKDFWQYNMTHGFASLFSNPVLLTVFNYIVIAGIFYFITRRKSHPVTSGKDKTLPIVLGLIAVLSLLPAFLVTQPSFPFRVITLTLWAAVAFGLFYLNAFSRYISYIVTTFIIFVGLIFSLQILSDMRLTYNDDERLTNQIVSSLDSNMKNGQQATVILQNMPFSTNTVFNYGEYLASCVRTDWCVQMELARKTDKVKRIVVNPSVPVETDGLTFTFMYMPEQKELVLLGSDLLPSP